MRKPLKRSSHRLSDLLSLCDRQYGANGQCDEYELALH